MNVSVSSRMYDNSTADTTCSTLTPNNDDKGGGWSNELSFLSRIVTYFAILGAVMIIVFMVLKFLASCDDDSHEAEQATMIRVPNETAPLLPQKTFGLPYGTNEDDPESGTGGSSSEDLSEGKICVICYDMPRNCFFVPCGHCATCHDCANRIMVESGICPICRAVVHKVRKLIIP